MAAFFRNTTQPAKDGNVKDSAPSLVVPAMSDRPRWDALPKEIAAANEVALAAQAAGAQGIRRSGWPRPSPRRSTKTSLRRTRRPCAAQRRRGQRSERHLRRADEVQGHRRSRVAPDGKLGPAPVMKAGAHFRSRRSAATSRRTRQFSYGAWIKAGRNGVFGGIIARMDEKNGYRGWDLFQTDRSLARAHRGQVARRTRSRSKRRKPVLKPGKWQHVFVTYDGSGKPGGVKIYRRWRGAKLKVDNNT